MKKTPLAKKPRLGAKERIVQIALKLFYRDGVKATGIDRIIADSGVAKMSFYRHFPSKNHLIVECLKRRSESWLSWFEAAVEKRLTIPAAGLEVIAEVLRRWFEEPDFRGCPFINALAETPSPEAEINQVIRAHKVALESWIGEVAMRLDYAIPKQAASSVMIVVEGTIIRAQMTGDATVTDACHGWLKKLARANRKTEPPPEAEEAQLYLPGIG